MPLSCPSRSKNAEEEANMRGMGAADRIPGRPNLEKPLEELTQQDIMQLTREDCRRYLKEKGMRRPSWNKSQAIQQVLSLKNLFDTRTDEEKKSAKANGDGTPHSSSSPPEPQRSPAASNAKYLDSLRLSWLTDAQLPVLATQPLRICRQTNSSPAKQPGASAAAAQLTIFYAGNVNVYDDVPPDKAQAIMLLAGGTNYFHPSPSNNNSVVHSTYPPNPTATTFSAINGARQIPATVGTCSAVTTPFHSNSKETPVTRKASLQRFLEKKKDRSRCKAPAAAPKKPLLMGMFMHPSFIHHQYWSESSKKKCIKPPNAAETTAAPPSMEICSTTKHNSHDNDDSVHNSSSEIPCTSSN